MQNLRLNTPSTEQKIDWEAKRLKTMFLLSHLWNYSIWSYQASTIPILIIDLYETYIQCLSHFCIMIIIKSYTFSTKHKRSLQKMNHNIVLQFQNTKYFTHTKNLIYLDQMIQIVSDHWKYVGSDCQTVLEVWAPMSVASTMVQPTVFEAPLTQNLFSVHRFHISPIL